MLGNLHYRVASVIGIKHLCMVGFHTHLARILKKILNPWTDLNKELFENAPTYMII